MGLLAASAGFLDPRGGLLGGFQGFMQGHQSAVENNRNQMMQAQMNQKFQDEQDVRNAFSQFGRPDESGNVDHGAIFKQMMGSGNPALVQFALMNAPKMQPKAKFNKVVDDKGVARFQAMFDNGTFGEMSGAPAAERLAFQDTGAVTMGLNPFTGQPVTQMQNSMSPGQQASLAQSAQQFGARMAQDQNQFNQRFAFDKAKAAMDYDPSFLAEKASSVEGAKRSAQNLVQAQADLPKVLSQGEDLISQIKRTVNHPGFENSVGKSAVFGKMLALHPGTQEASFKSNLDQLLGQQFLQAFESLKGGGQITEIEGQKATDAMSRMKVANTEEDFVRSANEVIDIVRRGMNRAKVKAGQPAVDFPSSNLRTPDQKKSAITPGYSSKLISD
jgi:hypothetical protein